MPEYWLIDPIAQTVLVLSLAGDTYQAAGILGRQETVALAGFPDLALVVEQLFGTDNRVSPDES